MPLGNDFVSVAAGGEHSLALKSNSSMLTWANDNYSQDNVSTGNDFATVMSSWWEQGLALVREPAALLLLSVSAVLLVKKR